MGFGDTFIDILKKTSDIVKATKYSMDKRKLEEELATLTGRLFNLIQISKDYEDSLKSLVKLIDDNRGDKDRLFVQAYLSIYSGLTPKARNMEDHVAFSSFTYTIKLIQNVVIELREHLDRYIGTPELNQHNMRISHIGILGFVRKAQIVTQYFNLLFTGVLRDVSHGFSSNTYIVPKYRLKFLDVYRAQIVPLINRGTTYDIFKDVLSTITEIRQNGNDLFINTEDGSDNSELIALLNDDRSLNTSFVYNFENPVLTLGKIWLDVVHWFQIRRKKEKEWMESRVAVLRFELNNMDESSDEYKRLVQIADNYDREIIDLDEKLNKYFI